MIDDTPPPPAPRAPGVSVPPIIWNTLTGITLALTACACAFYTLFFFYPRNPLNPFPPATLTPRASPTVPAGPPTLPAVVPTLPPAWTPTPANLQPAEAASSTPAGAGGRSEPSNTPTIIPTSATATTDSSLTGTPTGTVAAPGNTPTPDGGYPGDATSVPTEAYPSP